MTFNSLEELKQYVLKQCEAALQKSQEQVFKIIDDFVKKHYAEYDPKEYERTYQFYQSLVKTDIKWTGNGYEAYVYFDADQLDYSLKRLKGSSCVYQNQGWSGEKTVQSAAHGLHGGYDIGGGTAVWDEPLAILNNTAIETLKKNLINSGIPLK